MMTRWFTSFTVVLITTLAIGVSGCASKSGTGTLAGAGVGALVGQAVGHNTASTLIGTGVGAGVGYLIGNEMDKNDVANRQAATEAEMQPFAGTTWQLVSVTPPAPKPVK